MSYVWDIVYVTAINKVQLIHFEKLDFSHYVLSAVKIVVISISGLFSIRVDYLIHSLNRGIDGDHFTRRIKEIG